MKGYDEGFARYSETTVSLGPSVLIGTVIICILLNSLVPVVVYFGRRADRRTKQSEETSEEQSVAEKSFASDVSLDDARSDDGSLSLASYFVERISKAATENQGFGRGGNRLAKVALQNREKQLEEEKLELRSVASSTSGHTEQGKDANSTIEAGATALPVDEENANESVEQELMWFEMLLHIAEWNDEMKHICKLGVPFVAQAAFQGMCETVRMAVIGKRLGTDALSAYVMVMLLLGFSQSFVRGFSDSLTTVCSQAVGAKNYKLAGEYVQLSMILYVMCFVPIMCFWMAFTDDAIVWFGFEAPVPKMGRNFAFLAMFNFLVDGLLRAIYAFMNTIDLEVQNTIFSAVLELISLVGIIVIGSRPGADLQDVGFLYLVNTSLCLVFNLAIIMWKGWFDNYLEGFIGTFALRNVTALKVMLKTAIPLSLGSVAIYGEWELLSLFASFLGPAEVVTWEILGTLWGTLETITIAIGNAAEVRCAYLLGSNQSQKAKISAYKSLYLCIFVAFLLSSGIFIAGEDLPTWMTNDPTLQSMISQLIPLFGVGNISLTVGSVAWTLVGAQGRYRLATLAGMSGSWVLSIPLAAIFSVVYNVNLQGQTAAVVIGYSMSGVLNSYFLFRSDWEDLARKALEAHSGDNSSDSIPDLTVNVSSDLVPKRNNTDNTTPSSDEGSNPSG